MELPYVWRLHHAKNKRIRRNDVDPFPQPETYANNYTRLGGDIAGLTSRQLHQTDSNPLPPSTNIPPTHPNATPPSAAAIRPRIDRVDRVGFRGENITVEGSLPPSSTTVTSVSIFLAPVDSEDNAQHLLGQRIRERRS